MRSHLSRPKRAHDSGRDTSHPLPPSHPPQTRSTLQRERWSANICSPGIGPSRRGERRWTLHLQHMTANGSSTPAPHASDSLRNPAGPGGGGGGVLWPPQQYLPEGGTAVPPPSDRPTTRSLSRWSPRTCSCLSTHDISWEAAQEQKAEGVARIS